MCGCERRRRVRRKREKNEEMKIEACLQFSNLQAIRNQVGPLLCVLAIASLQQSSEMQEAIRWVDVEKEFPDGYNSVGPLLEREMLRENSSA